jgi:hypothetical protein
MARYFIKQHFEKAYQRGYIPMFAQAALKYDFPLALLMAIASRETNMTNMKGDFRKSKHFPKGGYHGYGIMQVDVGTDPQWIASGAWVNDISAAIMRGTKILGDKRNELNRMWEGSRTLQQFLWVLAASYNTGSGRAYPSFKNHGNPDRTTTGKDYGKDVLGRMVEFQELLTARGITATSYAIQGSTNLAALPQQPASVTSAEPGGVAAPQQTVAGGGGLIIQSGEENTVDSGAAPQAVAGGGATDAVTAISTSAPVKSSGVKAIAAAVFASIWGAIQFFGIQVGEAFGYVKGSFQDNPLMTVLVIVTFVGGMVVYWKYQDRLTQLDKQREQNAHARDMANLATLSDPKQLNVVVRPPVPAAQKEGQPAVEENMHGQPVTFKG